MRARFAIVREVADTYDQCVTTQQEKIDVALAKSQHEKYCSALEKIGLKLIRIEADNHFPDCCFVEDTAIVADDLAIITHPGAISRRGETDAVEKIISGYKSVHHITPPMTIDGGDVLEIGKKIFIGLSERTSRDAIDQVAQIVQSRNYEVIAVPVHHTLHLKSAVTALNDSHIIMAEGFFDEIFFSDYEKIIVPRDEEYAANCLAVNETVFIPQGFPVTKSLIERAGFKTIALENSEFKKGDGALTCLSILF
ncbi:MAG: dimethylarginine dimethylaminohydrolase family protein [Chitinophagales bacterium]